MNEASSKYVDHIATEKLIQEKLSRVHHAPDPSDGAHDLSLEELSRISQTPEGVIEPGNGKERVIAFRSAVRTKYEANNTVKCQYYGAPDATWNLVFLHGLYEDNLQIYNFFISMLNAQGISVYLMILPFHYDRTPEPSAFSGEYFWSGNIHRSALAYKQAMCDLYQLYHHVRGQSDAPTGIVGFSMGGGIALSLAAIAPLDGVFVINPVCNISKLVWTSPLFSTIRNDLEANGITFEDVQTRYSTYEPLNAAQVQTDPSRIVLARSLYDQINDPANYDLLVMKWSLRNVISYKAAHLNVLRVPKLATDVSHFCRENRRNELL